MGHVLVEEGVVKGLHHQVLHQLLEHGQVRHHAGAPIDPAAHGDIEQVVVAVAIRPGALAVDRLVVGLAQLGAGEAMGGGEMGADRQEGFHGVVEHIGPEGGGFVEAQAHQGQVRRQALPDRQHQGFGGGQAPVGPLQVEVGPHLIEEAEIQLAGHFAADGVLHVREVQHHAIAIEATAHGHDQLVVVAVAGGQAAGAKAAGVRFGVQFRQPVAVAGAEGGPAGDHAGAPLAMGAEGGRRGRRQHGRGHRSARHEATS